MSITVKGNNLNQMMIVGSFLPVRWCFLLMEFVLLFLQNCSQKSRIKVCWEISGEAGVPAIHDHVVVHLSRWDQWKGKQSSDMQGKGRVFVARPSLNFFPCWLTKMEITATN